MYKIKDNVNLKELEKFRYSLSIDDSCHQCFRKDLEYLDYIAIYEDRHIFIDIEDFCGNSWEKFEEECLYDLIQAGLVEKVEEGKDYEENK